MKKRSFIEIVITDSKNSASRKARIIAKPCRNLSTRYWVVLPQQDSRKVDAWYLAPSVEKAVLRVSRWLHQQAADGFTCQQSRSTKVSHTGSEIPSPDLD